ncbi:DNA-binding transcriptional regulator Fis [Halomonas urmiana]|uniref:Putative Fis-like DNA-binding protein n=1 Tax=Halomonas urmiana TaxID=490901 RepID=A0A5R8MK62_9GAMM|nr:DNA-binding transcriptional regulator Fis [Halomonas urmiana]TLF52499.1 DNA-binding transcriptional regulator Fis [Halomonas urmiana]
MTSSQSLDQNLAQSEVESPASGELAELRDTVRPAHQDDRPLREAVEASLARYFDHLDGSSVTDLYAMVMAEVEAPLLASVLEHTQGNQTRAAEMLGLNRGTLRKKLKQYGLI